MGHAPYPQLCLLAACQLEQCYDWQHCIMRLCPHAHLDYVRLWKAAATLRTHGYGQRAT
jgi:hypothetical protein